MIRSLVLIIALILPEVLVAEAVVPTRTIRANATISETDVTLKSVHNPNAFAVISEVVGQEARTTLYAGRPIMFDDVGPPALVARNQIVVVKFQSAGLTILTEGRSLQRGGVGDQIRIMNLDSRTTVFGQVQPDGSIRVFN